MKAPLVAMVLLNATISLAAPLPVPRERPRITEKMKVQLEERTGKRSTSPEEFLESDMEIIELEPLEVRSKDLHFVFDHEKLSLKSAPFTWADGGTFLRHEGPKATTEWKFQYDPINNVIQFFSLSF